MRDDMAAVFLTLFIGDLIAALMMIQAGLAGD